MAWLSLSTNNPCDRDGKLPLYWWERCCIALMMAAIIVYGVMQMVAADSTEHQTGELQSVLRAGWAVRTQKNIYEESQLPFSGPPILAALVTPLAHPPTGENTTGLVPWTFSVGVSYFFNCLCLILAIHWVANAVEAGSVVPVGCRRWWYRRVVPGLILIVSLSVILPSGSSHAMTLLLIAGMFVNLVNRQNFGAGVWLGGAISLEIVTALLVFVTIWRRDRVMTMGTVLGLALGMLLLPGLVFGLQQTNQLNVKYFEMLKQTGMNHVFAGACLMGAMAVWAMCTYLLVRVSPSGTSTTASTR